MRVVPKLLPPRSSLLPPLLLFAVLTGAPLAAQTPGASHTGDAGRGTDLGLVRPVRILPLGDSITHGGHGHASYRYPLWYALAALDEPVTFVGGRRDIHGGSPDLGLYPLYYRSFDREHEGHWGFRTDQAFGIAFEVAEATRPDVVLVHLGTNDIGQAGAAGLLNARTYLPRMIDSVRAVRPTAGFVLARVLPIGPGTGHYRHADQVAPLNALVATIAARKSSAASPIVVVDQSSGFDLDTDMQADGLHPNEVGEAKMAAVWLQGILPLLDGPSLTSWPAVELSDAGFELGLADGVAAEAPTGIGWAFGASGNVAGGVFDPGGDVYAGAGGAGTPFGAEGSEVAFLESWGGEHARVVLFQTLPTTLTADLRYTLTVAVGRRIPGSTSFGYGGYRMELLAGEHVVASEEDEVLPMPGRFRDATVVADASRLDAALLGEPLTVRLTLTAPASPVATDFDHVRLVAE